MVSCKPQVIYSMLPICRRAGRHAIAGAPPRGAHSCVSANCSNSPIGCLPLTNDYIVQISSLLWTALKQLDSCMALLESLLRLPPLFVKHCLTQALMNIV